MTLLTPYTNPEAFNTGQNIVTRHGESGCRGVELTWESNPNSVFNCPDHSTMDVSKLDYFECRDCRETGKELER